jgi:hypothetical protein
MSETPNLFDTIVRRQSREDRPAFGRARIPSQRSPLSEPLRLMMFGSTGMLGRAVMRVTAQTDAVSLVAVSRREIKLPPGVRLELRFAPTELWEEVISQQRPERIACALGTTMKKAGGDEEAFRAVDEELVLEVARAAKKAGVGQFIFVSAAGADDASTNFYFKVKGEVERELSKLHFDRLDIIRPGLLRGERIDDQRPGERLAAIVSPLTDLVLRNRRRRFRSLSAATVAQAILGLGLQKAGGRFVHDHDAILRAAKKFERALDEVAPS